MGSVRRILTDWMVEPYGQGGNLRDPTSPIDEDTALDTRESILNAATQEFVQKGFAGARTQEIADRAGVNKAMLHYYFGSKDALYGEVITSTIEGFFATLRPIFDAQDTSAEDRLRQFIDTYLTFLSENPHMPRLLAQDLLAGESKVPGYFVAAQERSGLPRTLPILSLLQEGIGTGEFAPMDVRHTTISLIGMSVFYFIGKPILDHVLEVDAGGSDEFLAERKRNIADLLLHGLVARGTQESDSPHRGDM